MMGQNFKIALAQTNPTVGAIEQNASMIKSLRSEAKSQGVDLIIFSEMNLCGYPPEDLVLRPSFLEKIESTVYSIAEETKDGGPAIIIGAPWRQNGKSYNSALVIDNGSVVDVFLKHHLPNYGVFDEQRVFSEGQEISSVTVKGLCISVLICEDMWFDGISKSAVEGGAELLIVINGSPFEIDKENVRLNHAISRVSENNVPLIYVNQVGAQDDLVFDGGSFVLNSNAKLSIQGPWWNSKLIFTEWVKESGKLFCKGGTLEMPFGTLESVYNAVSLGLKDYVCKNNFPGVIIGLSGGIDSALSAVIAVDALGPEKVLCVMMPSPYTSQESLEDAAELAKNLGVEIRTIEINSAMNVFESVLDPFFKEKKKDTTEENIQSRIRGLILMALSNKLGHMVLSTGNKSEVSVGYATLYGDMCGGYSVLKDIYKSTVLDLCEWRNENTPFNAFGPEGNIVPDRIISKPPSAELRPDQKDEDSLPPYSQLDEILKGFIEDSLSVNDMQSLGHDKEIVTQVWRLICQSEYKRRQAAPGVKISQLAFGRDRRYPITNAFDGEISFKTKR